LHVTTILSEPVSRATGGDSVRRDNLAKVIRLVHDARASGLSRSELTSVTGLNRSTIAALVGELAALGLITESEPLPARRVGRPSPVVSASGRAAAIAVNPEIDAITVGVVGLGGQVAARVRVPTDAGCRAEQAVALTAAAVRELVDGLDDDVSVVGIGVAVPGLVRASDGLIRLAPHFGWVDEPFSALLTQATGLPVSAANDATLGARAEATFGAGRGIRDLVYLNGGASGIGGGIVSAGHPLSGAAGYAGELGHTLVNSAGVACHCGATGCLETEVRRESLLAVAGLDDSGADGLEAALRAGGPEAMAEVHRQLDFLGVALRNAINIFNPGRIILGGFLAALGSVDGAYLDRLVRRQPLAASREGVTVVPAELGRDILMIGAAELAFAGLLADPASFG
jgi:predicted NBD/HSP70 family sugar kinase